MPQFNIMDACYFCGATYECAHKKDEYCKALSLRLKRRKETLGKRTSEGYKPKPDEKVEVRGD